jgi:cytochrome o ubiquinol oxidase subunit 3
MAVHLPYLPHLLHFQRANEPDPSQLWAPDFGEHDTLSLRSLGFWLYMMSDAMIFAGLFAAYGAYVGHYAGSFTAQQVLDPLFALVPTFLIFASVLAYGLGMVALKNGNRAGVLRWLAAACALGFIFLGVDAWTFTGLAGEGAIPQKSAYLSDFWILVWTHGLHVFIGLIWMLVMIAQVAMEGLSDGVIGRLVNLRIFWFFQAIIWVCVFTVVYLLGAR